VASNVISVAEIVAFYALSICLLYRGWRGRLLTRFPLFYTYLIYMVATDVVTVSMYAARSPAYPRAVWARLLTGLVAEIVVLLEVSDHLFTRFAAVRRLGRFLAAVICAAFLFAYVLPALSEAHTSRQLILEFYKRASLTKAVVIVALLAACRFYRLPLTREVSGILVGFAVFLTSNIVNCALMEELGVSATERAFGIIGPLSYTLGMLIWTVALWNPKPAPAAQPASAEKRPAVGVDFRLEKLNTTLTRLLRR
jgi:uncharacterized membrane protein YiaA